MKKIICILLVACGLAISGCNKSDNDIDDTNVVTESHEFTGNIKLFEKFYSNVKNRKEAHVEIIHIGKDGTDIKSQVIYSNNMINISRSVVGGDFIGKYSCKNIDKRTNYNQTNYYVSDCKGEAVEGLDELELLDAHTNQ